MYRFFEVFKTLKLPEDLAVYFENVEVTKLNAFTVWIRHVPEKPEERVWDLQL